jgi:quercetin dioxygenase-like cupin family protein
MEMTTEKNVFIEDEQLPWQTVGEGIRRKIVGYDRQLMMVKVAFETGGVGAVHEHYHSQITHIESGKFEIEIGGEKKVLSAGDAYYIPPHVLHGALCLEAGVLIDVFSPMREDFL